MPFPRLDGLFARLMLAQAVLVLLVGALFFTWLTVARARSAAPPYAQLWAANLSAAAIRPAGEDDSLASPGYPVHRSLNAPSGPWFIPLRFGVFSGYFMEQLAMRGLVVDQCVIGLQGDATLWLHVLPPGRPAVWLSLPVPPVLPAWNAPTIVITLLAVSLVGGMSWTFARRVTRPLERLRKRIALGAQTPVAQQSPMRVDVPAEVLAIEADYDKLIDRLRTGERERALLMAGVSHDLRSPLGRIRLAAEMLPVTPETQADLGIITRNIDHAGRLIDSFLDFVRAGLLPMDETVDVAAVARSVISRFERDPHELRLELQDADPVQLHRANALLVDRLIFNLVDNALKHGRAPVSVSVGHDGNSLVLDVRDLGDGFPGGARAMLDAFARGDASRAVPGSGLGLSVVQQVTERLGGTLQFTHDAAGHRARVTLT
jgi:two-component system osmolarity sensor histidine kinase EnvZ